MKQRLLTILFIAIAGTAQGQYYSGLQMEFGKNRVQYDDFYWSYVRTDRFDVYYYMEGKEFAKYIARVADDKMLEMQQYFEYQLDKRIIFIVYNTHSDFKQSNIGYVTGQEQTNTGGVTKIVNNKVILYYNGEHEDLEAQIKEGVATVIVNEMIYGTSLTKNITSSTLISLPEWYVSGLIEYVARGWDAQAEQQTKDGMLSGRYEHFNRLTGDQARIAGRSFWYYIAQAYGESELPSILYFTRVTKSMDEGFLYVVGTGLDEISQEWVDHFTELYQGHPGDSLPPANVDQRLLWWRQPVVQRIHISPDGKKIAYLTNYRGLYKIWVYHMGADKLERIHTGGHKLEQIVDYSNPVMAWHPGSRYLSFVIEREGHLYLHTIDIENDKEIITQMYYTIKVLHMDYSDDGSSIVMSAVKDGMTDIFVYSVIAQSFDRLTFDVYDDLDPVFVDGSEKIMFSSNRDDDTLRFEPLDKALDPRLPADDYDLFLYDYRSKSPVLTRMTDTRTANERMPVESSPANYYYLSDENGIVNIWQSEFDSVISTIDTAVHYRYYTKNRPYTNSFQNISYYSYNPDKDRYALLYYQDGLYRPVWGEMDSLATNLKILPLTPFAMSLEQNAILQDSLEQAAALETEKSKQVEAISDTVRLKVDEAEEGKININNYTFEIEKEKVSTEEPGQPGKADGAGLKKIPSPMGYVRHFYPDYMVTQIDFSYLNQSYQAYTGGPIYFNPGFNMFLKLGAVDLFEDYRLTGGVRFSFSFDNFEYLFSLENNKKRLDKQFVYYRRRYNYMNQGNYNDLFNRMVTQELKTVLKYPFTQTSSIRLTLGGRYDKDITLPINTASYTDSIQHTFWALSKLEYVYDNTFTLGMNLYEGTRYKLFAEYYQEAASFKHTHMLNGLNRNLLVIGADFRHYLKIHRELIWANRFAISSSFGNSRLIYYLGSLDNWIILSSSQERFDYSIPVDRSYNYAFQTLATNMRGFIQNIRNGNSFSVINSELRWPFVRYFSDYPLGSDFLYNLQLNVFGDIGTAWSRQSPWDEENAWNIQTIEQNPVTVTVKRNKSPLVYGYGFGLRTRLFGYFIRADYAWGIENNAILPPVFYLSLSLDF